MAELGLTFNARLYAIEQAFERGDLGPLVAYLQSGTIDADVQRWLGDLIDPAMRSGIKLVIKRPRQRPSGGKTFDSKLAIAKTMDELKNNPADNRTEEAKAEQVRKEFGCSISHVRKSYRAWRKSRDY